MEEGREIPVDPQLAKLRCAHPLTGRSFAQIVSSKSSMIQHAIVKQRRKEDKKSTRVIRERNQERKKNKHWGR